MRFLSGLFLILGSTSAMADAYVDLAAGAAYGRYRATTVHEESDGTGDVVSTFTKKKSGTAIGVAIAVHAGYRTHGFQLGGVFRFARYSIELPDVDVIDGAGGRRIDVAPPYTTSLTTTAIGPMVGYEYLGWFARAELGVGKLELGDQPCLCFARTGFRDVVTAGAEAGYQWHVSRDWVVAPVAAMNGSWAKVSEQVDFLDTFETHARAVEVTVMASLVYQPR